MPEAVAINVAANTTLPGFRGPVYPDGSFTYVPIPEREPAEEGVPTYADLAAELDLPFAVPEDLRDRQVHLDPAFAGYPLCDAHTYGDEHGVKAGPISDLSPGDYLLFYATLSTRGDPDRPWVLDDWGAYLVGGFRLAEVLTGEQFRALPAADRERFAGNAHVRRERFDAKVLVRGDPADSGLFDRAVPLSAPGDGPASDANGSTPDGGSGGGATANRVVTELAGDSGKGPWWRRVLRFDAAATDELLALRDDPGRAID
jgi:hypothetical protein